MKAIISKLSDGLKRELKLANEIWIAVGLVNFKGLSLILDSINRTCKINFIAGIDLPTDPKALYKLLELKTSQGITANVLIEHFFHPKTYIIKSGTKLSAFVGSANCTAGGLEDNIEMSIHIQDFQICKSLIDWFEKTLVPISQPLTSDFIKDYKPKYDNRIKRRKKDKIEINQLKKEEEIKIQAKIEKKSKLISLLKQFRREKEYLENRRERQRVVRMLRASLDYPNFEELNLKTFFSIRELGTIVPLKVKGTILKNRTRFKNLMKLICNEKIPLNKRIDEALYGKFSLENIKIGFISKVLVIHRPKLYYVHNKAFDEILKPFGLTLPKGLTFGEKYEIIRNVLKHILKETNIEDFAILDFGIWRLFEIELFSNEPV